METCKTCRFYEADWEYHYVPEEHYPAYIDHNEKDKPTYVGRCRIRAPESRHCFPQVDERAWCGEWERIVTEEDIANQPPPPPSGRDLPT